MDDIRVDRLALTLSGLSEAEGRRLAMLITQGLAAARLAPDVATKQPAIHVDVKDAKPGDVDRLSDRVVAQVLRQIERSL
jgi:hypothetical protein